MFIKRFGGMTGWAPPSNESWELYKQRVTKIWCSRIHEYVESSSTWVTQVARTTVPITLSPTPVLPPPPLTHVLPAPTSSSKPDLLQTKLLKYQTLSEGSTISELSENFSSQRFLTKTRLILLWVTWASSARSVALYLVESLSLSRTIL